MITFFKNVWQTYLETRKSAKEYWVEKVMVYLASIIVQVLKKSSITPNQITFFTLFLHIIGCSVLALFTNYQGLLFGAIIIQISYIFDGADGQLARLKGMTSEVGALLDFLIDEFKAYLVLGSVTLRLYLIKSNIFYLIFGMAGIMFLAMGIGLTKFLRNREIVKISELTTKQIPLSNKSGSKYIHFIESIGSFIIRYPYYFIFLAVLNLISLYFYIYIITLAAYTFRSFLSIVLKFHKYPISEKKTQN